VTRASELELPEVIVLGSFTFTPNWVAIDRRSINFMCSVITGAEIDVLTFRVCIAFSFLEGKRKRASHPSMTSPLVAHARCGLCVLTYIVSLSAKTFGEINVLL
jgi:hypothetical protein